MPNKTTVQRRLESLENTMKQALEDRGLTEVFYAETLKDYISLCENETYLKQRVNAAKESVRTDRTVIDIMDAQRRMIAQKQKLLEFMGIKAPERKDDLYPPEDDL